MKGLSVLDKIQKHYPNLSGKEREVADYISSNKESILNINIRELAEKTNSSTSTITRFCKKIECSNFVEFKIRLNSEIGLTHEEQTGFKQVESFYKRVVNTTIDLLDEELIHEVVSILKKASKIYIYGVGSSGLSAQELKYRLLRMGFNVDAIIDPHMMLMSSALTDSKDVLICISNSGKTEEIIHAARIAKENGANIISITNYDHTRLTEVSDSVLFTASTDLFEDNQFINTQLSIQYVMDIVSMLLLEEKELVINRKKTLEVITWLHEKSK